MKLLYGFIGLSVVLYLLPIIAAILLGMAVLFGAVWLICKVVEGIRHEFSDNESLPLLKEWKDQDGLKHSIRIRSKMGLAESVKYDKEVKNAVMTSSDRGVVKPLVPSDPGHKLKIGASRFKPEKPKHRSPHSRLGTKGRKPEDIHALLDLEGHTPHAKGNPDYLTSVRRAKFSVELLNKEGVEIPANIEKGINDVIHQMNGLWDAGIQDTAQGRRTQKTLMEMIKRMADALENLTDSVYAKKFEEIEESVHTIEAGVEMDAILNRRKAADRFSLPQQNHLKQ